MIYLTMDLKKVNRQSSGKQINMMKKLASIIIFLIGYSMGSFAQEKSYIGFYTDRDVYVSGESVLTKMYIPFGNSSGIAHIDLVNQKGKRISGVSVEIKNKQADGFFQLPDSLSSGTYLLRAYLRNTANNCRIVREIWVANRFDGLDKVTAINQVGKAEKLSVEKSSEIELTGLPNEVKINTGIQAQVKIGDDLLQKLEGDLLISIARVVPEYEPSTFKSGLGNGSQGLTESKGIIFSSCKM